ncbi:MAG: hypothetical protein KDA75_04690 [Planctomycetaceae bacterium]|nr:hypothetical protein [Planctomycetaceae bacterium]
MSLRESQLWSSSLENRRRLWFQPSECGSATAICVFLDAEYYLDRLDAASLLGELQSTGQIPPVAAVYVSHVDQPTRWRESFCNPAFADFLADDLLPTATEALGIDHTIPACLIGLSLTGLAAAHVAVSRSDRVSRVVCQSASFWWDDESLTRRIPACSSFPERIRIACGGRETVDLFDHGDGLVQRVSQLTANRRMRDALLARGADVSYSEFDGGHDLACWRDDLPASLAAAIGIGQLPT